MNLGKLWEMVRDREARRAAVHGVTELETTGRLNNARLEVRASMHWTHPDSHFGNFSVL